MRALALERRPVGSVSVDVCGGCRVLSDVGTIDAYFHSSLDTLGPKPAFELSNPEWPIRMAARAWPPARVVTSAVSNSLVGAGALIRGARVRDSIVRRAAVVHDDAQARA